jgi:hypothetical protein
MPPALEIQTGEEEINITFAHAVYIFICHFVVVSGLEYINYTTHFSLHDSPVIDVSIMKGNACTVFLSISLKYHIAKSSIYT